MKRAVAPVFGSDVGNGFGEVPAVPAKVLGIVLALAVGVIAGFGQDDRSVLPRTLAVALGIFNPDLNQMRVVRRGIALSNREASLAGLHLDTVIGDA